MLSTISLGQTANQSPPPKPDWFHPVHCVLWAHLCKTPGFSYNKPTRRTAARVAGIKYERAIQNRLEEEFGPSYLSSPWFRYCEKGSEKPVFCQPDGLLFLPEEGKIVIVEVKLKHCTEAWWQLRHKYEQVVAAVFPPDLWALATCEVVKWYDAATSFPEPVSLCPYVAKAPYDRFNVHICGKP